MRVPSTRAALIAVMGVVAGSMGSSAASAASKPPVVVVDEVFSTTESDEYCGVDVTIERSGGVRVTEWYDDSGDVVRARAHVNGTTTITSELGTLIDQWVTNESFDPATLELTIVGNPYNVRLPGSGTGVLVNDAGKITINVATGDVSFIAGPHPAFLDGSAALADACAALWS